MRFEVRNHRLLQDGQPVSFRPAHRRNCSTARMVPKLLVHHDTAGRLEPFNSVSWFENPSARASAHLVVERDGTVTQMVALNQVAYHAGKSSWHGQQGCNAFAIGVEIVSPGKLTARGDTCVAWFGQSWPKSQCVELTTPEHGHGWWLPYSPEQIEAVKAISAALPEAYPSLVALVAHYDISPKRKVDVGPHWPMIQMREAFARHTRAREAGEDDVTWAQEILAALGYWPGGVDGDLGALTRSALERFQRANGLAVTGNLDAPTRTALASGKADPMPTAPREELTVDALRTRGSQTIRMADNGQRGVEVAGVATVAGAVADQGAQTAAGTVAALPPALPPVPLDPAAALKDATETVATLESAKTLSEKAVGLLDYFTSPQGFRTFIILLLLGGGWWALQAIKARRAADAQAGKHIGR